VRKDVREFIRRLEAVGLTVESTPGHYRVLRDGKPLRKANGMPFTLPLRSTCAAASNGAMESGPLVPSYAAMAMGSPHPERALLRVSGPHALA
jgi:hypothetical protein